MLQTLVICCSAEGKKNWGFLPGTLESVFSFAIQCFDSDYLYTVTKVTKTREHTNPSSMTYASDHLSPEKLRKSTKSAEEEAGTVGWSTEQHCPLVYKHVTNLLGIIECLCSYHPFCRGVFKNVISVVWLLCPAGGYPSMRQAAGPAAGRTVGKYIQTYMQFSLSRSAELTSLLSSIFFFFSFAQHELKVKNPFRKRLFKSVHYLGLFLAFLLDQVTQLG